MKYYKIKSKVLSEALKDRHKFSTLYMYIGDYLRSDGYFVSEEHEDKKCVCQLKASLLDFLFNEEDSDEWNALYEIGNRLLGIKTIDMTVVNIVDF